MYQVQILKNGEWSVSSEFSDDYPRLAIIDAARQIARVLSADVRVTHKYADGRVGVIKNVFLAMLPDEPETLESIIAELRAQVSRIEAWHAEVVRANEEEIAELKAENDGLREQVRDLEAKVDDLEF